MAQEVEQERRQAAPDGGGVAALHGQEQDIEDATWYIDPDLVDAYVSAPLVKTVHSILAWHDPRYDTRVISVGIRHGGYRRALEKLLKEPPPRHPTGTRVIDYRARMLERLGRYEQAEALYRDVAEEIPWSPEARLDMARVLEHLGRPDESAKELACVGSVAPDYRRAFEMGMHPDPRQLDPAAVPLRLIVPMSVISAAGIVRSRAELSAASLLVQAECGLDLYPPAGSRLPGCAGLGADMERFYHLVVEDVVPHCGGDERPYYYDLTDAGIDMIGRLGERLDGAGGPAASRIAESARRVAGIGAHAVLEEACGLAARPADGGGRAEALEGLRGTAGRIRREVGNGIAFGGNHAGTLLTSAEYIPGMLSQAGGLPDGQWAVAYALGADMLGLCARIAFDQRPHPRTAALGPPYPDIQDLHALFAGYCGERGVAEPRAERPKIMKIAPEEDEEIARAMRKVISESWKS